MRRPQGLIYWSVLGRKKNYYNVDEIRHCLPVFFPFLTLSFFAPFFSLAAISFFFLSSLLEPSESVLELDWNTLEDLRMVMFDASLSWSGGLGDFGGGGDFGGAFLDFDAFAFKAVKYVSLHSINQFSASYF